jgi:hypothetical protein
MVISSVTHEDPRSGALIFSTTKTRCFVACRFPVFFFALNIILLGYIRPQSCASFVLSWLGLLPNTVRLRAVSSACVVSVATHLMDMPQLLSQKPSICVVTVSVIARLAGGHDDCCHQQHSDIHADGPR